MARPIGLGVEAAAGGQAPAAVSCSGATSPKSGKASALLRLSALRASFNEPGTGGTTSAPTIVAALTPDHGFDLLADWSFPVGGASGTQPENVLHSYVFRVDRSRLAFDSSRIYMAPDAAERLIGLLERDPVAARPIAARLLSRIEIMPAGSGDAALLARLRRLAGW